MSIRPNCNALRGVCRSCRRTATGPSRRTAHRLYSQIQTPAATKESQRWRSVLAFGLAAGVGGTCWRLKTQELYAEAPEPNWKPTPVDVTIEEKKDTAGLSKEDNRALISNQHQQVKHSWENPGVYAWGSNAGRVTAPDSNEAYIKTPRRIPFFDGLLLRDLKLTSRFGAAISETGDLLQWGTDYSPDTQNPVATLRGKNLVSLSVSSDRIIALSSSGAVYSVPVSKLDQEAGHKPTSASWVPFWPSRAAISYRTITPSSASSWLPFTERVTSVASGLSHALILTSSGRLFSAAASTSSFPAQGQLGIPGLTWVNRPVGAFDQPHELTTLHGFKIRAIAAGDNHSLALDSAGRVFAFGDNGSGQLGLPVTPEASFVDAPSLLPIDRLYSGTSQLPSVTAVFAGGNNSFFSIDATRVAQPSDTDSSACAQIGRVSADTWACGSGILGSLGTGRWTHNQTPPAKIKSLSGLFEFDEPTNKIIPIRVASLSVGQSHSAATLANVTYLDANKHSGRNDTNWGADVVWWGGNQDWQLGTGKRNNASTPTYIGTLEGENVLGSRREEHRFHATPKTKVAFKGRSVEMEQRVVCGRGVSGVYSGV